MKNHLPSNRRSILLSVAALGCIAFADNAVAQQGERVGGEGRDARGQGHASYLVMVRWSRSARTCSTGMA